jgi:hypothetical protein
MDPALNIFRGHKIFDQLDSNALIPFDGATKVHGTEILTDRVSPVIISKASQIIIKIQLTDVLLFHYPSWFFIPRLERGAPLIAVPGYGDSSDTRANIAS